MRLKSAKAKGDKRERLIAKSWEAFGWKGRRQPMSGAIQGLPGDVVLDPPYFRRIQVESKAYRDGWKKADAALDRAEIVRVVWDDVDYLYQSEALLQSLLKVAEGGEIPRLIGGLFPVTINAKHAAAKRYLEGANDWFVMTANYGQPNYLMRTDFFWELCDAAISHAHTQAKEAAL